MAAGDPCFGSRALVGLDSVGLGIGLGFRI